METREDLAQALSFQLDLLRLAMAPHTEAASGRDTASAAELERLIETVPARLH
jgi:hypothetical protein